MRQRTINWAGAMRDMRKYRSPENRLIREMLTALKAADQALAVHGITTATEPRTQIYDAIRKAKEAGHV